MLALSYQDERGYTLIELIVALLITLTLGGVLYAVYLGARKRVEPWQREMTLENDAHLILQRLTNDLAYADQIFASVPKTWTLAYPDDRTIIYHLQDSVLFRNDHRMHTPIISVLSFDLSPSQAETRYALRRRDGLWGDERSVIQIDINLVLASRERHLAISTTTAVRRHRPWLPL